MRKTAPVMMLMLSFPLQAQWYEATGQATIRQGDKAAARAQATEDAIRRALLFAGVSVKSVQQMTDGLLTQDNLQFQSYGDIQQIQVVSERSYDGLFEVTIRADILPTESVCAEQSYKKKILISPFKLKLPEQAIVGGLFELGKVSSHLLSDKLAALSQSSWPHNLPATIDGQTLSHQEKQAIVQKYGARYVLSATLEDVSLGEKSGMALQFWTDADRERFYHLDLTLYDLADARVVLSQKYQTSAIWSVRKTTTLDPAYQRFWQTPYGKAADRVIEAAVLDVEEAIRCESVVAEVQQVMQNQVLLNLGRAHGVKVGDEFQLVHRRRLTDNFGQPQQLLTVTTMKVQVTQLSEEAAWAQSIDAELLANVQAGDLATVVQNTTENDF